MSQTTVLVDRYRNAAKRQGNANSYKGLTIHALPGLHDFIETQARKYFAAGGRLLDLAAGSGAMSQRMTDLGFAVTATDYVPENFKLANIPFLPADLNSNFSEAYPKPFDSIIASEIIEHLENPRHFARESYKSLVPGGRLLLTTPNLENAGSKASFLRDGAFLWFSERDYGGQGHITPLTQWQIRKSFEEAGFARLWEGSFGQSASQTVGSPRLRMLTKLVTLLSSTDAALGGEIFVAVFERRADA